MGISPQDDIVRYDNYKFKEGEVDKQLGIDWKHRDESILMINKNNDGLHLKTFNNQQDQFNKSSSKNLNKSNIYGHSEQNNQNIS